LATRRDDHPDPDEEATQPTPDGLHVPLPRDPPPPPGYIDPLHESDVLADLADPGPVPPAEPGEPAG
jgi:hypothetical protein